MADTTVTEPRRHLVRGVLGGLFLGLGLALLLILLRVTAVPPDLVIGVCLVMGIVLGGLKLPGGGPSTTTAPRG